MNATDKLLEEAIDVIINLYELSKTARVDAFNSGRKVEDSDIDEGAYRARLIMTEAKVFINKVSGYPVPCPIKMDMNPSLCSAVGCSYCEKETRKGRL